MSWYLVVLLIMFYIVMWSITAIAFTRLTKNSDPGWIALGFVWPLVLTAIPFVAMTWIIEKIVKKYCYKEE